MKISEVLKAGWARSSVAEHIRGHVQEPWVWSPAVGYTEGEGAGSVPRIGHDSFFFFFFFLVSAQRTWHNEKNNEQGWEV
jgi:hypothetical protein